LAVCSGSHRAPGLARLHATYGRLDMERDGLVGTGWLTTDPTELLALDRDAAGMDAPSGPTLQWRTADFAAGDVVLFGMSLCE